MAPVAPYLRARLQRIKATFRVLRPTANAAFLRAGQYLQRGLRWRAKDRGSQTSEFEDIAGAMERGDIGWLDGLAASGPDLFGTEEPESGQPWFHIAVELGDMSVIDWMLDRGVDVNSLSRTRTCAIIALLQRDKDDILEVLDKLIRAGVDVNYCGPEELTPLHEAAKIGAPEFVWHLLQNGANPHAKSAELVPQTPIQAAREAGRLDNAKILEAWLAREG